LAIITVMTPGIWRGKSSSPDECCLCEAIINEQEQAVHNRGEHIMGIPMGMGTVELNWLE